MISYASSSPEIFEQITYLSLVHLHTDIAHLTRVLDEQIFAKILNKINALGSLAAEQKEAIKSSTNIVLKRLHEPTANIAGHVQVCILNYYRWVRIKLLFWRYFVFEKEFQ